MEIVIVVGSLIIGFYLGWNLRERFAVAKVQLMLAEMAEAEEELEELEDLSNDVVRITIERDDNNLFAYHKENSQFITQASNRAELEKKLAELFPGKKFGVTPKNLAEIGFTS